MGHRFPGLLIDNLIVSVPEDIADVGHTPLA